jgi:hypothetical protein
MNNDQGRPRQPGETVVLRYLTRDGRPGMCWPAVAVEDRDDLLALWIPEGATYKQWRLQRPSGDAPEGTPPLRTLVDGEWRRDTLRLMFPGAHHSIWLSWDRTEAGRAFHGYYVNLEEPFRRTSVGFDTNDHALDVVVAPDLTWTWKDEDELERRAQSGIYYPDFAARVRAEGERAIAILEERRFPFTGDYVDWAPEPSWGIPGLLDGWDTAPPALWPDRLRAYADASPPRV